MTASKQPLKDPCYTECDDCQRHECNVACECLASDPKIVEMKKNYNASHSSQPVKEQENQHPERWAQLHDAAIEQAARKAEREQYASELIDKIEKYLDEREQPKCVVLSLQMVEKLIKKSLRDGGAP